MVIRLRPAIAPSAPTSHTGLSPGNSIIIGQLRHDTGYQRSSRNETGYLNTFLITAHISYSAHFFL
jgi:hypothetical protein